MKRLFSLVALSTLLALVYAGGGQVKPITDGDNGKTFSQLKGTTFVVKLISNPSTGYSWAIDQPLVYLSQIGKATFEPKDPKNPPRPGASQWQVFTFKAIKPGTETLKLRYYRCWEKKKDSDEMWSVKIKVVELKKKPVKK